MESLARFLIASTDLMEAEGRALKRQAARVFLAAGIGVASVILAIAGLGFLFVGLFGLVASAIGPWWAALIFGAVALAGAVAALLSAKKIFQ